MTRSLILSLFIAGTLCCQTATFPGAVVNDQQMMIASNNFISTLSIAIGASDTSLTVGSATGFTAPGLITFSDSREIAAVCSISGNVLTIGYAGSCPNTSGRGFDGTAALAHVAGAQIGGFMTAWHRNVDRIEIEAIENALGANLLNISGDSSKFNFAPQSPGGSLSAGDNTITLAPVPLGVNATDASHYLYISGGTGSSEPCLINGGTAVSGQPSGSIRINCANTHTGQWSVSSVAAGIPEAIYAGGNTAAVKIPAGAITVHGPIYCPLNSSIAGAGSYASTLNVAADFPLTASGLFVGQTGPGGGTQISSLGVLYTQPDSTDRTTYTQWPPTFQMGGTPGGFGAGRFKLSNILVQGAWDVVDMRANAGGAMITDLQAGFFDKGIWADGAQDSVYFTRVRFWPYGMTANQFTVFSTNSNVYGLYLARVDDIHVTDYFTDARHGIYGFFSNAVGSDSALAGNFENITLDSFADFIITCANIQITNLDISTTTLGVYPSLDVSNDSCTNQRTHTHISNMIIFPGNIVAGTQPLIHAGGNGAHTLEITNSWSWSVNFDVSSILQTGGNLLATNNFFYREGNTSYTAPTIDVQAGRSTLIGNRTIDKGSGAGTFIRIANDDQHQVRANSWVGWSASFPASKVTGVYEDAFQLFINVINLQNGIINQGISGLNGTCAPGTTLHVLGGIVTGCS